MATISTTLTLNDRMTSTLRTITAAVQSTITALESVDSATHKGFNQSAINQAKSAVALCNTQLDELNSTLNQTGAIATKSTAKMSRGFNKSKLSVKNVLSAIGGLSVVRSVSGMVTGQLDSAFKRMDTMTNYNRTMTAITGSKEKTTASLNSIKNAVTGTAYGLDTAASAVQNFTTRGMDIGNATSEVTKWLDAVSFYGEGTDEQLYTVTDALGKMMSKGTVEMEQLNRLNDVGINAVGMYAQATGRSSSVVQDALSKGQISSQQFITTVSNAFENGTNGVLDISGAAKSAATTWSATFDNMNAAITRGLQSLIDNVSEAVEIAFGKDLKTFIAEFGSTTERTLNYIGIVAGNIVIMLAPAVDTVEGWISTISSHLDVIVPIIGGVALAIGLFNGAVATANTLETISNGLKSISAARSAFKAKMSLADAAAIKTATGAQVGMNAAMLACPITGWIIGILAAIAIITACVAAFNGFKTETTSGIENLAGSIFVVGAGILNFFIGIINGLLNILYNGFVQPIENIMNWVYNFFTGGFDSIDNAFANLMAKMIGNLIGFAESFTKIWDSITGQNITAKLENAKSYMDTVGTTEYYTKKYDFSSKNFQIGRRKYKDAYNFGAELAGKIAFNNNLLGVDDETTDLLNKIANATSSTADSASNISDSVAATSSNIELIKDMAEEQIINRYTNSVNVEMINHNSINSDMDIENVTEHLRSSIEQGLNSNAGGAY